MNSRNQTRASYHPPHPLHLRSLLTVALSSFLFPISADAQLTSCSLEGRVVDSLGNPIAAANILVTGDAIQGTRTGTTDERGHFTIMALPSGKGTVLIQHVGYRQVKVENVSTYLRRTTALGEIQLHQQTREMAEVTISANRPLIDPGSTTLGASIRTADIEYLPVERNYRSIAALLPQANASYLDDEVNFAGATGRENKYFIDGVDVTDPSYSRAGTDLPYNFIKEIEVIAGGYEAEYRSALGGLVNAITYSGSNEVHGSAFGFFTNNQLSASHRGTLLDPTQGGFSNYDVGFGIGGPIVRDKLWFYAAYNPTFNRRNVDIPGFGTYRDNTYTHSFAGKLTWRASPQLNLVFTSTGDPTVRKAIGDYPAFGGAPQKLENPDPFLTDQTAGGINLSLSGSYFFSEQLFLDASVSRVARNQTMHHSTELGRTDTVLIDDDTRTWSGGGFGHINFFRASTTARTSGTLLTGPHLLKGGIEYRDNVQDVDWDWPLRYERQGATSYHFRANGTHGSVGNRIYSAYIQDNWQILDGLQVHMGLRLDGQSVTGGNGQVDFRVRGLLQPRIGFVFQPDRAKRQRIFGSFGRFMQEWTSAVMTIYTGTYYYRDIEYEGDPRRGEGAVTSAISILDTIPQATTLDGQYYDEFNLGYEALIAETMKVGVRGTYRSLREAIITVMGAGTGNPGQGVLTQIPRARRNYTALEISFERHAGDRFSLLASYVLSRNEGNYEGLYDSYIRNPVPNVRLGYSYPDAYRDVTGPLPNDRTHVFKLSGSYRLDFGLTVGTTFVWQSGTPLSEMADVGVFLEPRGTAGRTPSIWDLNARIEYLLPALIRFQSRLVLDVLHIASQRKAVDFDQERYYEVDASGTPKPAALNQFYQTATRYQPPMSLRLGLEVNF